MQSVVTVGDDFPFALDPKPLERHKAASAELHRDAAETRVGLQLGQESVDARIGAGQENIDAFRRNQHGALEFVLLAEGFNAHSHGIDIGDGDEAVGRDIEDVMHTCSLTWLNFRKPNQN